MKSVSSTPHLTVWQWHSRLGRRCKCIIYPVVPNPKCLSPFKFAGVISRRHSGFWLAARLLRQSAAPSFLPSRGDDLEGSRVVRWRRKWLRQKRRRREKGRFSLHFLSAMVHGWPLITSLHSMVRHLTFASTQAAF